MSLSCTCDEWEGANGYWSFRDDEVFSVYTGKRRTRCRSCGSVIAPGDEIVLIEMVRYPLTDIEERICGDEIPLAPYRFCHKCGEISLNLDAYGYCVDITKPMVDLLHEHWELTGFDPKRYAHETQHGNVSKTVKSEKQRPDHSGPRLGSGVVPCRLDRRLWD